MTGPLGGLVIGALPLAAAAVLATGRAPGAASLLSLATILAGGAYAGFLWQVHEWAWALLAPLVAGGGLFAWSLSAARYRPGHAIAVGFGVSSFATLMIALTFNYFGPAFGRKYAHDVAAGRYGDRCEHARLKEGLFARDAYDRWAALIRLRQCRVEALSLSESIATAITLEPARQHGEFIRREGYRVLQPLGAPDAAMRVLLGSESPQDRAFAVEALVRQAPTAEARLARLRAFAKEERLVEAARRVSWQLGFTEAQWRP
ncbi:MAG: hypothetical protein HY553_04765 [Elusimicrobia bacterium]|nr:hypothetical protein [Elusimicrobiota bacterium]